MPTDTTIRLGLTGSSWVVPLGTQDVEGNTGPYQNVAPGDTLLLEPGTRGKLQLYNLFGTGTAPITVINDGGVVDIDGGGAGNEWSLYLRNCKHIRVLGNGVSSQVGAAFTAAQQQAGIVLRNANRGAMIHAHEATATASEFIELAYCEVRDTLGNPGIHTGTANRTTLTRPQRSLWLHHNYIHDILDSEGFYIGSSTWNLGNENEMDGCVIEFNLLEDVEYDGIQHGSNNYASPGSVPGGYTRSRIHGNVIRRVGQAPAAQPVHTAGITTQRGNWRVDITKNWIEETGRQGIQDQELGGGYVIANNVIIRVGRTQASGEGINVLPGDGSVGDVHILNNTIVDAPSWGIDLAGRDYGANTVQNNVIVGTGGVNSNPTWWTENNNFIDTIANAVFVNSATDDYHLDSGSPCISAGVDVSSLGVTDDYDGNARPLGAGWDQGAYERV